METRITFRASQETSERLKELTEKYGVSQSSLLSMLVHERWLNEKPEEVVKVDPVYSQAGGSRKCHKGQKVSSESDINRMGEVSKKPVYSQAGGSRKRHKGH